MAKGDFFRLFFSERGSFDTKANGEVNVLCPFPHDNGKHFDSISSAHVNVGKGLFHCKTCLAQGNITNGGMSEISFIANLYGVDYEEALQMQLSLVHDDDLIDKDWEKPMAMLLEHESHMAYLTKERGLTVQTIQRARLGFKGDGIAYPIYIYGEVCDVRTCNPHEHPKMASKKGSSPLLFPFDIWRKDSRPTILCAGENDALITLQNDFNALTVTAGEGNFPTVFLKQFKGKTVYIIYDCDSAGKNASRMVAYHLKSAGAEVRIVDLGLAGTKEEKDLTDFFVKLGRTAQDLQALLDVAPVYDGQLFQEDKNLVYPLVDLWDVPEGKYYGRRLSSRVIVSGKYDTPMQTPSAIEWRCERHDPENVTCLGCPLVNGRENMWVLGDNNLKELMQLVDVDDRQQKPFIDTHICGIPKDCPNRPKPRIKARKSVYKVIFTPDVETEDILSGFRSAEQYAYVVGHNLEDGVRYRVFYRAYSHPLDGQRVYMIVDRIEESDNALNTFKMTDTLMKQLEVFQGDPMEKMAEKALRMHGIPDMLFRPNPLIAHAVNIMYHSPLRFNFKAGNKANSMKGYPEILVVGESRSGKTETAQLFQRYVQIGNFMALKGASISSLQGGAESMSRGGFKVSWGVIPQNNKGLVILDELSGMSQDVLNNLTAMRSSGIATLPKIKRATAPAHTRLYWTSNPPKKPNRQNTIHDYPNGVSLITDLVGTDEDIARFDICVMVAKGTDESSPLDTPELECFDADTYRNLIYWAWTRTAEQIIFEEGVEQYIVQTADELNDKYDTDVKLLGSEAWKKIARISVAAAINCFSHDGSGDNVLVTKSHVDWAAHYIAICYDNNLFRIRDYAKECRSFSTTNQSVNTLVAGMCKSHPMVIKTLLNSTNIVPMGNLRAISGLEQQDFSELINRMSTTNLIRVVAQGITSTRRLKLAVDAHRESTEKLRMTPLTEL